jgi:hypothetical protein
MDQWETQGGDYKADTLSAYKDMLIFKETV